MVMANAFRYPEDWLLTPDVPFRGTTSAPGNVGGTTIVCAELIGALGILNTLVVLWPEQPLLMQSRDISGFNAGNGTITVGRAFAALVPAGTPFAIRTHPPAQIEVKGVFNAYPFAPYIVEPDTTDAEIGISITTVGGIPAIADLTVGTITIERIRAGVTGVIVNAAACAAAVGQIFYDYAWPAPVWQPGDRWKATMSGQAVDVDATTYNFADIVFEGVVMIIDGAVLTGIADGGTVATLVDAALVQIDLYWIGMTLHMIDGNNAGLSRPIVGFDAIADTITFDPPFLNVVAAGDRYMILEEYHEVIPVVDDVENYGPRDVIGNKQDAASIAVTASIVALLRWIIAGGGKSLAAIYDLVNAILRLQETGGTLLATGGADNVYVNNAPAGIFAPRRLFIDLDNMLAGDSVDISLYHRITPTGGLQLYDVATYAGADGGLAGGRKLIKVDLDDTRYGIQVTLTQTTGGMRTYDWDVSYQA